MTTSGADQVDEQPAVPPPDRVESIGRYFERAHGFARHVAAAFEAAFPGVPVLVVLPAQASEQGVGIATLTCGLDEASDEDRRRWLRMFAEAVQRGETAPEATTPSDWIRAMAAEGAAAFSPDERAALAAGADALGRVKTLEAESARMRKALEAVVWSYDSSLLCCEDNGGTAGIAEACRTALGGAR